jgi:hypothetical protein
VYELALPASLASTVVHPQILTLGFQPLQPRFGDSAIFDESYLFLVRRIDLYNKNILITIYFFKILLFLWPIRPLILDGSIKI